MRANTSRRLYVEALESRRLLSIDVHLIRDIYTGPSPSSFPDHAINVNGTLYFTADDGVHGYELWKSDGTAAGTSIVKDISAGLGNSELTELTNVSGKLFFVVVESNGEKFLWTSDGTEQGTLPVQGESVDEGDARNPSELTNVNGTLYFAATGATTHENMPAGIELWRSDGTPAGTRMVKDINENGDSNPAALTNVNGTLFFTVRMDRSNEIWRSDGTAENTVRVSSVFADVSNPGFAYFTGVNSTLFFVANDRMHGAELWRSDGTELGTYLLRDINPLGVNTPGSDETQSSNPVALTNVNGMLFFTANDGSTGYELWRSDGTPSGTQLVADLNEGEGDTYPFDLVNVNGQLFFGADDGMHGRRLWKSDETGSLVVPVGNHQGGDHTPQELVNVDGTLYFTAENNTAGRELWKSNGTDEGTMMVHDILPGSDSSYPFGLTEFLGSVVFAANDGTTGWELWQSDGTEEFTTRVRDIHLGEQSGSYPSELVVAGERLFFAASDPTHGNELWASDGTASGTTLVKDIRKGSITSEPRNFASIGNLLLFTANDGTHGNELWKSDGTPEGTELVKDILPGLANGSPQELTNVGGTLFFRADDVDAGTELWKSDGTVEGTVRVKDIRAGTDSSYPAHLINVNGVLFFTATDGIHGVEVWRSDGTSEGTVMVRDIREEPYEDPQWFLRQPSELTNFNGTLYFSAHTQSSRGELWRSDGTMEGTEPVFRDSDGNFDRRYLAKDLSALTNVNGVLFFKAEIDQVTPDTGVELWKSDGTKDGTMLVRDVYPGPMYLTITELTNVNGNLFFAADNGIGGVELWKSDGTEEGTVQVKDVWPGEMGSTPHFITEFGGFAFFSAIGESSGRELWVSDGTESGTFLVTEFAVGENSSHPQHFVEFDGRLYFSARSTAYGAELWALEIQPPDADFNDDSLYDCADIDTLVSAIVAGGPIVYFDLNRDGELTLADRDDWLARAGAENLGEGQSYLLGDMNLDGVVDGADLNHWNAARFRFNMCWCGGDVTADGVVDGSDFNVWNANKFRSSGGLTQSPAERRAVPAAPLVAASPAAAVRHDLYAVQSVRSPSSMPSIEPFAVVEAPGNAGHDMGPTWYAVARTLGESRVRRRSDTSDRAASTSDPVEALAKLEASVDVGSARLADENRWRRQR